MKMMFLALGLFAIPATTVFAAEPAKMTDSQSGKILATPEGMTLYSFDKDKGGKSACDAQCLKMWPAFHAGATAKPEGDYTVVKGTDGKGMWAYKGMPLYLYREDKKAGDAKGDGRGGVWHVIK